MNICINFDLDADMFDMSADITHSPPQTFSLPNPLKAYEDVIIAGNQSESEKKAARISETFDNPVYDEPSPRRSVRYDSLSSDRKEVSYSKLNSETGVISLNSILSEPANSQLEGSEDDIESELKLESFSDHHYDQPRRSHDMSLGLDTTQFQSKNLGEEVINELYNSSSYSHLSEPKRQGSGSLVQVGASSAEDDKLRTPARHSIVNSLYSGAEKSFEDL